MELDSVLVTGANRGIGLEFVRQLVQLTRPPRFVFATYRARATVKDLKDIRDSSKTCQVILIQMDVTKESEIQSARKIIEDMVGSIGLTLLINNAGVAPCQKFPEVTQENMLTAFQTNSIGPVLVLQEMLPLLEKSAARKSASGMGVSRSAVLNLSSMVGSITRTGVEFIQDLSVVSYKMSKAALNMAMRIAAATVKDKGILVVMMCPGWVKTDMGTENAEIEVQESIATMLKTMAKLDESHHGSYMDRMGNPYPF